MWLRWIGFLELVTARSESFQIFTHPAVSSFLAQPLREFFPDVSFHFSLGLLPSVLPVGLVYNAPIPFGSLLRCWIYETAGRFPRSLLFDIRHFRATKSKSSNFLSKINRFSSILIYYRPHFATKTERSNTAM